MNYNNIVSREAMLHAVKMLKNFNEFDLPVCNGGQQTMNPDYCRSICVMCHYQCRVNRKNGEYVDNVLWKETLLQWKETLLQYLSQYPEALL